MYKKSIVNEIPGGPRGQDWENSRTYCQIGHIWEHWLQQWQESAVPNNGEQKLTHLGYQGLKVYCVAIRISLPIIYSNLAPKRTALL